LTGAGTLAADLTVTASVYVAVNAEYQAVLNYADLNGYQRPSVAQCALQDALVGNLKTYDIWNKLDTFALFATNGDLNFALIDWKRLNQYTVVNSPTFTVNQGITGNGTSSYIDTNFNPATNSVNYTLDNAGRFMYFTSVVTTNNALDGTISGGINRTLASGSASQSINSGNIDSSLVNWAGVTKYWRAINRTTSNDVVMISNTDVINKTATSTIITSTNQFVLRTASLYSSTNRIAFYAMGESLVSENTNFYNSIQNYITSL
jgi:hypothetical protein